LTAPEGPPTPSADADVVVCDVAALVNPDAGTVDALARLQLTARRLGRRVRLLHAGAELQGLLDLMGLSEELEGLPVEPGREAEEGEPASGVQKESDPGEPVP
jgi:hypothetical protein